MKIGILTSVELRHQYFARRLSESLDVGAIVYEQTGYTPANTVGSDLSRDDTKIVLNHFAERTRQEAFFLGDHSGFVAASAACRVQFLNPGELNSEATLGFLRGARIDALAVYGTNLLKPPLVGAWSGKTVNLHLGLAPYYRGTATNFYPLVNGEPEYVGATIHLIDAGIDSGPILRHARPDIVADDMPHTIGCKAIIAGVDTMMDVLKEMERGAVQPVRQWDPPRAKLYLRKDYHPRHVVKLYEKLRDGLIPTYVNRSTSAKSVPRLVT